MREAVRALTTEVRAADSRRICDSLRSQPAWTGASSILCYAALPDEPDLTPLVSAALSARKSVAFPRFDSATGLYAAAQCASHMELVRGPFGVLEPAPGCPAVPLNQLDLVLVPGVAFDFAGRRLGRGKGFYDRLLAEVRGHKCGVAFDVQLVARLPEEPHDVRVDSIMTPSQWLPARAD